MLLLVVCFHEFKPIRTEKRGCYSTGDGYYTNENKAPVFLRGYDHGCCFMHAGSYDWSDRCIHDDRVRKSLPSTETLVLFPLGTILVHCWDFDNLCFLEYMGASL